MPAWRQARIESAELTEAVPAVRRADLVVVLYDGDRPALAVVVEVQLRPDKRKRYTWPLYLASALARWECPTILLVVCARPATARWCRRAIETGHPDYVLRPLVLGPEQVPVVTDPEQARAAPELAVLSVLSHGRNRKLGPEVVSSFVSALSAVDTERAEIYHDVVMAVLPAAARRHLEGLMGSTPYQFRSEFALRHIGKGRRMGRKEGRVEGLADAVLELLAARDVEVPDEAREQITACTDPKQLRAWVRHAPTATTVEELLAE